MRWADEEARFIRPIRWIVALCGSEVVPMEFAHVKSGRISRGHRFLCKEDVTIESPKPTRKPCARHLSLSIRMNAAT